MMLLVVLQTGGRHLLHERIGLKDNIMLLSQHDP